MNYPPHSTVSIDRLLPYIRNSRTHSDEQVAQIAASIREFGFTNPVRVDGEGGIIAGPPALGGETPTRALQSSEAT